MARGVDEDAPETCFTRGMSTSIPDAVARVEAQLLAADGPFATEEALVLGQQLRVFRRRLPSLRAIVEGTRARGDAEAMLFTDGTHERRFSFAEHARLVASVAAALRDRHGVRPGDRVAILAANCPQWIVTFWATVSLGAIAVGLNAWWAGDELAFGLADAAPRLLLVDAKRQARLGAVPPGLPTLVIERDFAALSAYAPEAALPDVAIGEDDAAVILYTSGTTGRPKGVVCTHRGVLGLLDANAFVGARNALLTAAAGGAAAPTPCVLVTSPLFHVSGLHTAAVSCMANGVRSVWLMGRFDAAVALGLIEKERVTAWAYTATLLHRMVHHPALGRFDVSSLRQLGGGGSPIAPELQARARAAFPAVARTFGLGYGLTECGALATLHTGDELAAHPTSVGRPVPTVELEIRGGDGARVPDGVDGEVHIKSPMVMREYWRNPEATAAALAPGRWLRSGDIGRLEDGRLYLASRKRDLIFRGGENVYPVEIEQRLEQHPGVAEAAVIGVDHAELGQEVKAIVVAAGGAALDAAELARWVGDALAYFKVPAHWELRTEPLPRNATGKVLKEVLRGDGGNFFVPE
jgi:acyl-CoA synthetase (AMP-forming)/AMP-acid ligase II